MRRWVDSSDDRGMANLKTPRGEIPSQSHHRYGGRNIDTTQQYSNILKAIQHPPSEDKLSPTEKVENYDLFKKLNDQGIKLSDLIKRAEQNTPKQDDSELFSIMESAVKNEPDVKNARQHLADVKSQVLAKICYQHPEYKDAIDE